MSRIGVDIGGTKIHAVLLDAFGEAVDSVRMPTPRGEAAVLGGVISAVEALSERCSLSDPVDEIGVGIPGAVDLASGRVANAVNLGISELDLGEELRQRFGRPVHVDNDVNAAALGVHHLLMKAGDAPASLAYLNIGTGMAAGIVIDGALWRGFGGAAGEVGHLPLSGASELCPCGQRGCIETVASGSALIRRWGSERPVAALFEEARRGNRDARAIVDDFARGVAAAIQTLALTIAPDRIVIGGGVTAAGEALLTLIRDALETLARGVPFFEALTLQERVSFANFESAAALGAALGGVRHRASRL